MDRIWAINYIIMYINNELYLAFRQLINQMDKAKRSSTILRYGKIERYSMYRTYYRFHIEAQAIAYMMSEWNNEPCTHTTQDFFDFMLDKRSSIKKYVIG